MQIYESNIAYDLLSIVALLVCRKLTLPMLRLLSFQAQGHNIFENHRNPVMLVLIR